MAAPRKKYKQRPKKRGAAKKNRVKTQKKRLVAAGFDEKILDKMTLSEIREALKAAAK